MKSFEHNAGKYAWCAIGIGVLAYDAMCPNSQTLSEAVDRAIERRKGITIGAIGVTALHLANVIPEPVDPLHQLGKHTRAFAEKYL